MLYFLAIFPILVVLGLMVLLRWGGNRVGPIGWLVGSIVAFFAFGLPLQGWIVSQLKGIYLSLNVLLILWPAMYLYHLIDDIGGIQATAQRIKGWVHDQGLLVTMLALSFSGMLEGLAGFGIPIAVVSPMLVGLGVTPVLAIAATAIGHSWAVTFGDMGVVYQTLISVTGMNGVALAPFAALLLGFACLLCGLSVAKILKHGHLWPFVVAIALTIALVQYLLVVLGLTPMAGFGAGLAGVLMAILLSKFFFKKPSNETAGISYPEYAFRSALYSYGFLAILMSVLSLVLPIHQWFARASFSLYFQKVQTLNGYITAASSQVIQPLLHPGFSLLVVILVSLLFFSAKGWMAKGSWKKALKVTIASSAPVSIGVLAMIGLATAMDYSGMTYLLAKGIAQALGGLFPLASPFVGILGAFATGSNNNSNVLFAKLQQDVALLLAMDPRILIAAQTTGGALGSMIAPAKIFVGCATTHQQGSEGEILRHTLPYVLIIGILVGVLALVLSWI